MAGEDAGRSEPQLSLIPETRDGYLHQSGQLDRERRGCPGRWVAQGMGQESTTRSLSQSALVHTGCTQGPTIRKKVNQHPERIGKKENPVLRTRVDSHENFISSYGLVQPFSILKSQDKHILFRFAQHFIVAVTSDSTKVPEDTQALLCTQAVS